MKPMFRLYNIIPNLSKISVSASTIKCYILLVITDLTHTHSVPPWAVCGLIS